MPDPTLPQYTFAPWVRRGVGNRIAERDRLGADGTGATERATVDVELELGYVPKAGTATPIVVDKVVHLLGPGEIRALTAKAILRRFPDPGSKDFAANMLAYVEFFEEDLPWRYTPARTATEAEDPAAFDRLRPWISLLVLAEDEFELDTSRTPLPVIRLKGALANEVLPPETETWCWAHAQANEALADASAMGTAIESRPERALSRLLSPRRLAPRTRYAAFLVPTFETGRLGGLDLPYAGVSAQAPAWKAGAMPHSAAAPNELPTYAWWAFSTGEHGDFESLVRLLRPGPAGPEFGRRGLDASQPGFGLDGVAPSERLELEGALRPPSFVRAPFPATPGPAFADALESIVDLSENLSRPDGGTMTDDPIVTPPTYGAPHAGVRRVYDARGDAALGWLRELNLDPRSRAPAQVGAQIVRDRQEELMERAWAQLDEVDARAQRQREAELSAAMNRSLHERHIVSAGDDRTLTLTSAMQGRLRLGGSTVRAQFTASRVPNAATAPAFKRITRPQRKVVRRLTGTANVAGLQGDLIKRLNLETSSPVSAAPPVATPAHAVALGDVSDAIQQAQVELGTPEHPERQLFVDLVVGDLRSRISSPTPQNLDTLAVGSFRTALTNALSSRIPATATGDVAVIRAAVEALIAAVVSVGYDGPPANALALVVVSDAVFAEKFGEEIGGKFSRGVTVRRATLGAREISPMTTMAEVQAYGTALSDFTDALVDRPVPAPRPGLTDSALLAADVTLALAPTTTIAARVAATLPAAAPSTAPHRVFEPVRAHPIFDDSMFQDLRAKSQDFVLPNFADLAENRLTLLETNQRFVEAFMAGLNHELSRELLWREYPTDLRGTYFSKFWDTHDAIDRPDENDITPMHTWTDALGTNSGRAGGFVVLVVRGDLFRAYPNTMVYAHRAAFTTNTGPRSLAPDVPANVRYPAFSGRLDPDINLFGFALGAEEAKGRRPTDPGWFFVFQERPGEARFGLDDPFEGVPALPLNTWDDLNWSHIQDGPVGARHIGVTTQPNTLRLSTPGAGDPTWGRTSADLAAILLQSPILYARHAEELLP